MKIFWEKEIMLKGNKKYEQKINGLYHRSRIKHFGLELVSHRFYYNTLNNLSNDNDNSLELKYYSPSGLNFKSNTNFIKNFRLSKKLNNKNKIDIK